jgi:amidase
VSADAELMFRPITELAEMVRKGEISSRELVETSLSRIEELDGDLGAFNYVDAEGALATADSIRANDGRPFAGVPIAIKDNRAVAGMPLNFSANLMGDFIAPSDSRLVERFREAGFVIVGKTKLPEYGLMPVTDPTRGGPARNPWDLERTPGGSSGGSAAAVAAGMVPIAHANDGGGSTRIPAACCGLVGLKGQRGRVSLAPQLGESFLISDGVLTRTSAESAAVLDILEGYETGDATWATPPSEPYAKAVGREPGMLKVGWTTEPPIDAPVDSEAAAATERTAALLAELGHDVQIAEPGWKSDSMVHLFSAAFGPAVATQIIFAQMIAGREATEADMEPLSWMVWQQSQALPAPFYLAAMTQLNEFSRSFVGFFDEYDLLLTPALAERPVKIGEIDPRSSDPAAAFARSGQFTPFTAAANVTGLPGISIPIEQREDGLPLAVQLMAGPEREDLLLQVSRQLEEARPWAGRRAPFGS